MNVPAAGPKPRIVAIDTLKGLCMLVVVMFHVQGLAGLEVLSTGLFVSLSLFFAVSGFFFRPCASFRDYAGVQFRRLLVPFLFFYLTLSVVVPNVVHYAFGVPFTTVVGWPSLWAFVTPEVYPNVPVWFLWCLFVVCLLFYGLHRLVRGRRVALSACCVALSVLSWWLSERGVDLPANVDDALFYLPMFLVGWLVQSARWTAPAWLSGLRLPLLTFVGRHSLVVLAVHGIVMKVAHQLVMALAHGVSVPSLFAPFAVFLLTTLLTLLLCLPLVRPLERVLQRITPRA